jgi:hypothetical protein
MHSTRTHLCARCHSRAAKQQKQPTIRQREVSLVLLAMVWRGRLSPYIYVPTPCPPLGWPSSGLHQTQTPPTRSVASCCGRMASNTSVLPNTKTPKIDCAAANCLQLSRHRCNLSLWLTPPSRPAWRSSPAHRSITKAAPAHPLECLKQASLNKYAPCAPQAEQQEHFR